MLEPVEVSSRPWICSYGHASSSCGLSGPPMADMLLWTRPSHGGYALCQNLLWRTCSHGYNPQLWISFYLRTGFLFDGERPDSHFKTETPSKCVYFYERLF